MIGSTIWLTGLSGAGKTTIGTGLIESLPHAVLLDGDDVRAGLNADLGFSRQDRAENVRRLGEVALLIARAGQLAVVTAISPYIVDRERVRSRHAALEVAFLEVYISTPLSTCEVRDPKQLYARARAGTVPRFTGVSDSYEPPLRPDLVLPAHEENVETCVNRVIAAIPFAGIGQPQLIR